MCAFVVLGLVFFNIASQEIGLGKCLWNDLFCFEWDVKPQLSQSILMLLLLLLLCMSAVWYCSRLCVCIYLTVGASEADVGNQEEGLAACDGSWLWQQSDPGQGHCEGRRRSALRESLLLCLSASLRWHRSVMFSACLSICAETFCRLPSAFSCLLSTLPAIWII